MIPERLVVLVELDYQYESSGVPTTGTLRMATSFYVDESGGGGHTAIGDSGDAVGSTPLRYRECINTVANFQRSLTGPTLGTYQSSLGTLEIDNANHEYDNLLKLAIDNSEVRVYSGLLTWAITDFRLMFKALSVKASAPSQDRISITLKDATALLDKSVGGEVLIGGTGPNAQQFRTANFGFNHQVPCQLVESATLLYSHSDRGDNVYASAVYDRGILVDFNDNNDGTVNLAASPEGQITADVYAVNSTEPPGIYTARKVSDAFYQFVSDRGGFGLAGRYAGAGPTFTVGDADDYLVGTSLTAATNIAQTLLPQLAQTGNCFWAIRRTGELTFGRLDPNDVAGLGLTPVNINYDDIDKGTLKEDKLELPTYYRLQALFNKNWYVATDVAAAVDPDTQASLRNPGLTLQQEESVGTTYADSPELYNLSLAVSPVIETWVSVAPDDSEIIDDVGDRWMERQRFLYLPWLQGISFTTGIEFYELELGDVVNLTIPWYGCSLGALFQVVSVNLKPDKGKVDLTLLRRTTSDAVPPTFSRITTALLDTKVRIGTPPNKPPPPPTPPDGLPPVFSPPYLFGSFPYPVVTTRPAYFLRVASFVGRTEDYTDFWQGVSMDSAGTLAAVGISTNATLPTFTNQGRIDVYERAPPWTKIASLVSDISDPDLQMLGFNVSVSDDGTIAASEGFLGRYHFFNTDVNSPAAFSFITETGGTYLVGLVIADASLVTGDYVRIAGASPAIVNGVRGPITVADSTHFSFTGPAGVGSITGSPITYTRISWTDQLVINTDVAANEAQRIVINADGDVAVMTCGNNKLAIYKKTGGSPPWVLQQTIDFSPDLVFAASISRDGMMIATTGNNALDDLNVRIYESDPTKTSWTITENLTPTSETGTTGEDFKQTIALARDKTMLVAVAPNDQGGAQGCTVFVYKHVGLGFVQIAFVRVNPPIAGFQFLPGLSVALSDGNAFLFIGDPYDNNGGDEAGRLFYVTRPDLLSGVPLYIQPTTTSLFTEIPSPYAGSTNSQHFGESLSSSSDGSRLVLDSGDFNDSGQTTVDFYELVTPLASGIVLYADTMSGAAGSNFSARAPNTGGAYTSEFGNLADMVVDGAGNLPSKDTSVDPLQVTAASDLTQSPNYVYRLSITCTVTAAGAGAASLDVAARIASGDDWLVEWFMGWNGSAWTLSPALYNSDFSSITPASGIDVTANVTTGVEHTFTVDVNHSARTVVWKIDGTTVHTDSVVPNAFPDSIVIQSSASPTSAVNVNVSDIRIVTL